MRKMRAAAAAVFLLCVLCALFRFPISASAAQPMDRREEASCYSCIRIEEGQTLESIEEIYNDPDLCESVHYLEEVRQINSLVSDRIHPGCYLTVPCYRL